MDDLNTSVCSCGNGRAVWYFNLGEAEGAVAGLVEGRYKGNVEDDGVVAADTQIDVCDRPWMAWGEGERTSVNRPLGSVRCHIDSATYIYLSVEGLGGAKDAWQVGYGHGLVYCVLKESPRQ